MPQVNRRLDLNSRFDQTAIPELQISRSIVDDSKFTLGKGVGSSLSRNGGLSEKIGHLTLIPHKPVIKKLQFRDFHLPLPTSSAPPGGGINVVLEYEKAEIHPVIPDLYKVKKSWTRVFGIVAVIATVITYLAKRVLIYKLPIREHSVFKTVNVGLNIILGGIGSIGTYAAVAPASFDFRLKELKSLRLSP